MKSALVVAPVTPAFVFVMDRSASVLFPYGYLSVNFFPIFFSPYGLGFPVVSVTAVGFLVAVVYGLGKLLKKWEIRYGWVCLIWMFYVVIF